MSRKKLTISHVIRPPLRQKLVTHRVTKIKNNTTSFGCYLNAGMESSEKK